MMKELTIMFKGLPLAYIKDESGEYFIAVKPICDALEIDHADQTVVLKKHPIYGSTIVMNTMVAADNKRREMLSIPVKFVFGWLLGIDSRKVKSEAREQLLKYQVECHDVLYNHFVARLQKEIDLIEKVETLDVELKKTKDELKGIRKKRLSNQTELFA